MFFGSRHYHLQGLQILTRSPSFELEVATRSRILSLPL